MWGREGEAGGETATNTKRLCQACGVAPSVGAASEKAKVRGSAPHQGPH